MAYITCLVAVLTITTLPLRAPFLIASHSLSTPLSCAPPSQGLCSDRCQACPSLPKLLALSWGTSSRKAISSICLAIPYRFGPTSCRGASARNARSSIEVCCEVFAHMTFLFFWSVVSAIRRVLMLDLG